MCYNNENSVLHAVNSILQQTHTVEELIVIDDGSSDNSCEKLKKLPVRIHRLNKNKGRGFARNLAMKICKNDLVLCCDATNSLDTDFLRIAIEHFKDNQDLCSVSGIIKARSINGAVSRWRSRHLFKEGLSYLPGHITNTTLVTYGTLVRKSIIMNVGNYNPKFIHSEDEELGQRLKRQGYKSWGNPKLITYSEVNNSIMQVLERHWRWHIGKNESINLKSYINLVKGSFNPMMIMDIKARDPLSALISFIYPYFFLIKTIRARHFTNKSYQ